MPFYSLYRLLRREEIDKASTILKRINIDTILQRLSKLCWKNNIQCETVIKTRSTLILRLTGSSERILFKYQRSDFVQRREVDTFLSEIDQSGCTKGYYIATGSFEKYGESSIISCFKKRDLIIVSGINFIKSNLGVYGRAEEKLKVARINFLKYLPK